MTSWSEETSPEPEKPTHNAAGVEIPWAAFEADNIARFRTDKAKAWKVDCRCEPEAHWTPDPGQPSIWYVRWHHDPDCPAMKVVMAFNN